MSGYFENVDSKRLLAVVASVVIAGVVIAALAHVAAPDAESSDSAQSSGFTVPGPIAGGPLFGAADYPYYPSLRDMKKNADAIVKGTVIAAEQRDINISGEADRDKNPVMESCWVSSVRVDEAIKGDFSEGDVVDVKQPLDGDPIGMGTKNSHGVLFLKTYEGRVPASPINPYQGVVPVIDGIARPNQVDDVMPRGLKEDAFIARVEAGK